MIKTTVKKYRVNVNGKTYVYGRILNLPKKMIGEEVAIIPFKEYLEIQDKLKQVDALKAELREALRREKLFYSLLEYAKGQVSGLKEQLAFLEKRLRSVEERLDRLESAKLAGEKGQLARLKESEKEGDRRPRIVFLPSLRAP